MGWGAWTNGAALWKRHVLEVISFLGLLSRSLFQVYFLGHLSRSLYRSRSHGGVDEWCCTMEATLAQVHVFFKVSFLDFFLGLLSRSLLQVSCLGLLALSLYRSRSQGGVDEWCCTIKATRFRGCLFLRSLFIVYFLVLPSRSLFQVFFLGLLSRFLFTSQPQGVVDEWYSTQETTRFRGCLFLRFLFKVSF